MTRSSAAVPGALIALVGVALASVAAAADGEDLRPLCPDRPGKGTSPCTIDAGHVQVEGDILNLTQQRTEGLSTDTYVLANPTVKYGVTDDWEIGANLAPFVHVRTHDAGSGATKSLTGIGDLFLRSKFNIVGNGGGALSVALDPFLKLPTARTGIGNGATEGGLLIPASLDLGDGWSLGTTPELDLLKNAADGGRHVALVGVVGLSRALADGVSVGGEVWSATDMDPSGTTQQYSLDVFAAWIPPSDANLQIDGGVNLGLNRATPGLQFYLGLTRRF